MKPQPALAAWAWQRASELLVPAAGLSGVEAQATALAQDHLLSDVLQGLPYQSPFMEITFEEWRNMSHGRRREITNRLESLLRLYAEYNRERRFWTQLEGNPNPNEAVFPVPLDNLP